MKVQKVMLEKFKPLPFDQKLMLLTLIATVFAGMVGVLSWQFPYKEKLEYEASARTNISPSYTRAYLEVSSANSDVKIRKSSSGIAFENTSISSANGRHTFYLPKGQPLTISLTGANVDMVIDKSIADQVQVQNRGAGNDIAIR